jgi:hypothetical protein
MKILNLLVVCFITGDAMALRMGVGFQPGNQNNIKLYAHRNKISNFVNGKALLVQDREGYILYPENYPKHKIIRIHAKKSHPVAHHAYIYTNEASSSRNTTHIKMPKKNIVDASNEHIISFKIFNASFVLTNKSGKVLVTRNPGVTNISKKYIKRSIEVQDSRRIEAQKNQRRNP